jgi:hypothetical protein
VPVRPVPVASGKVHTKFWQNVVGGWEVEIAYTTEKVNGNGASRRVLYRTDRKPRPFGAPYGGFYSRPLAEEFARSHVEQGLELLNMETPLRRAPRYLIAGDLPAAVHPVGRAKIRDLSLGGACAEHDEPLRAAQDVTFAVDLPAGRFGTTARVVWSTPLKRPGGGGGRFRSGFRFLDPGMQDLDILQAFFASA